MPAARTGPDTPPPEISKQSSQSLCAEGEEITMPQGPHPARGALLTQARLATVLHVLQPPPLSQPNACTKQV